MVVTFEEITQELNKYEKEILLPVIIRGLNTKIGVGSRITNGQMVRALKADKEMKYKVDDVRVRRVINYIRNNDLVLYLVSTSKGYYRATKRKEVEDWMESQLHRAMAILTGRASLGRQLNSVAGLETLE